MLVKMTTVTSRMLFAALAADPPTCPKNTVTIGNQGQVINVPQQSQVGDDDPMSGGLLGDLPVVGNLPGAGRHLVAMPLGSA